MSTLPLLDDHGGLRSVELGPPMECRRPDSALHCRVAYAAAHVIPLPWGENAPGSPAQIDWEATLEFRRHLYSWGLGVADAMDTAQRNMGLDPAAIRELITRSAAVAADQGGRLVVGVNTDHLAEETAPLSRVIDAYIEQLEFAEDAGAGVVLMASRHLARAAQSTADYRHAYREVLRHAGAPVILHWLGAAFDPELAGYFGTTHRNGRADIAVATDTLLHIIDDASGSVAGVKMSLLDADAEIALRNRLPAEVRMFTGDDFNYVRLIADSPVAGGTRTHSDALLGAFAALAPHASAAIQALDGNDTERYRQILQPTEALARHIFEAPTFYYKTGIAFLSWLNGHQAAFSMVGGLHAARSLRHLSRIVDLANECGALERPELAVQRWRGMLTLNGLRS